MGVYIKGMKMPTRCWDCLLNTYGYCIASEHSGIIPSDAPIPDWCPLVPVPPHGRLIDADALYRKMFVGPDGQIYPNNDIDNWPHTMPFKDIKHHILFAPTIIPAEEGE